MALTVERMVSLCHVIYRLNSFPIFCLYFLMLLLAGTWQRLTKPVSLKPILILYNILCVGGSVYVTVGFVDRLYRTDSLFSTATNFDLLPCFYLYWLLKIFELLDTVFMVLRHKQRQISFLHVFHHSSMLLLSDLAFHRYPWPAVAPTLALNSFVHIYMYLYYGLAAAGFSTSASWKRLLTQLQLLQFFLDLVFHSIGYLYHGFCIYGLFYGVAMIGLFSNFYYRAYINKKSTVKKD